MKEQEVATVTAAKDNVELTLDTLRTAFFGNVFKFYVDTLLSCDLPPEMNRNVIRQTADQVARFEREVRRTTHGKKYGTYLDRNLKQEKLLNMATILDCMARVGAEEHQNTYEEFLGLTIDLIDGVFYAQQRRKNLHFGKYKALFKLISDEMKRDVNRQPSQLLFTNKGELFMRSAPPPIEPEVK